MATSDSNENGKKGSLFTTTNIVIAISLIAILILVIVSVIVTLSKNAEEFEGEKILKAKTVLGQLLVSQIQDSDIEKLKNYNSDFDKNTDWKDELELIQLCDFATLLLKYYNEKPDDTKSKEYLEFANNVIKKIDSKIFKSKDYSIIAKSGNYNLFCSLTKLLNTFEYFADDSYQDTKIICHSQILHMIPEFNKLYLQGVAKPSIGGYLKDYESIYTITARLLTNAISDRDLYNYDVKNREAIKVLKEQFAVLSDDAEKKIKFNSYPYYYNTREIRLISHVNTGMEDDDRKSIISFGVIIGLLVITVLIIYIYSRKKDDVTIELKDILGYLNKETSKISDTDFKRIKIFERDRRIYLTELSLDWKNDSNIFIEVCDFAVRLLKLYHQDPAVGIYMTVANDILRKINDLVLQPHNYDVIRIAQGTNWTVFLHLLKLLNTFEYLADENFSISRKICHEQILEFVPECTRLHSGELVIDEKAIYTTTVRLLTNFLFDKELYQADIENNKAMKILKDKFDILEKSKDKKIQFIFYNTYKSFYNVFRSLN